LKNHVRIVSPQEFTHTDRWDVRRFWTDEELVQLGTRTEATTRLTFIEDAEIEIVQVAEDLQAVKKEIEHLEEGSRVEVYLSDETLFRIRRGKRVTRTDGDRHPGAVPVYSGSKDGRRPLCCVSEQWAKEQGIPIETGRIVTVNANGFVGAVFVRKERCIIHDDVMIIEIVCNSIDHEYLRHKLRAAITEGNFEYEAKLYSRVKDLCVEIPVCGTVFDVERQRRIADALKKFENLKMKVSELGAWAGSARIKD